MSDSGDGANFTIKDVPLAVRERFRGYARRHSLSSKAALDRALAAAEAQDARTEVLGPTIEHSVADQGQPGPTVEPALAHAAQLASAGLKPPAWLLSGLWRQIAAEAGVAVPAGKPPGQRSKTPKLLTDRRQRWQENSRLHDSP